MTLTCPRCNCEIQFLTGEPLDLTLMEHRLLVVFRERPCEYLSRDALLNRVWDWPMDVVTRANTRTVHVHISRLRRKLEAAGYPDVIQTAHGRGWRLLPGGIEQSQTATVSRVLQEKDAASSGTMVV